MKRRILGTFLFLAAIAAIPVEAQFSLTKDDPCFEFLQDLLIPGYELGFEGGLPSWNSVDEITMTIIFTTPRLYRYQRELAAYGRDLAKGTEVEAQPSPEVLQFLAKYRDCLPTLQRFLRELSSRATALNIPALNIEGDAFPDPVPWRVWGPDVRKKAQNILDEINAIGRKRDQLP